jgi:alginate O-acetyltransferase complex protein AlgI
MLFSSVAFIAFFLVVFTTYWGSGLLPLSNLALKRGRVYLLLASSYFFYGCWSVPLLSLIAFSTLVDFVVGQRIGESRSPKTRRTLLVVSVCTNLGLLGIFKYANFFIAGAQDFLLTIGVEHEPILLNIILPLGISFYTFQSMSYTIDIYRGTLQPERNFGNFALFISFFPQLVAGPIVRASDFLWQVQKDHRLRDVDFDHSIDMILRGLIKKVLVADVIAGFVDTVFAAPEAYGTINTWLAMMTYTIQIYCDFSGYSDVAIGIAGLLGYRLPKNFDFPLMARGFSEFWRRWHISLFSWLRDYLFIPLGGNSRGALFSYRNLLITMVLSGLWHGASYAFLIWGLLHGLLLVGELIARPVFQRIAGFIPRVIGETAAICTTVALFSATLVFFRPQPLSAAFLMARTLFTWVPDSAIAMPTYTAMLVVAAVLTHVAGDFARNRKRETFAIATPMLRSLQFAGLSILLILASESHEQPFIYFQF